MWMVFLYLFIYYFCLTGICRKLYACKKHRLSTSSCLPKLSDKRAKLTIKSRIVPQTKLIRYLTKQGGLSDNAPDVYSVGVGSNLKLEADYYV
jgi:hypothetical protein